MTKKMILKGAIAAIAIVGGAATALAGPSDKVVYGNGPVPIVLSIPQHNQFPGNLAVGAADFVRNLLPADQRGARYEQESNTQGNTETATPTVQASFSLSGTVDKDCSFYSGGVSNQAINLGTIGIRTGNNDNSTAMFDQTAPIAVHINTSSAGCNTQNQITITKGNGASGLLNNAVVAYDSNAFTKNIPYEVKADWTGVPLGPVAPGGAMTLTAATTDSFKAVQVGAWRSAFDININAPVPALGLIAGTYNDTVTVELKAL